jgi:hypothetical protein
MSPYARRDFLFGCPKKATEFFHGQSRIVNDSAQGALRQLRMIWHRQPSMGRHVEPEYDVASGLVIHLITDLRKRLDDLSS